MAPTCAPGAATQVRPIARQASCRLRSQDVPVVLEDQQVMSAGVSTTIVPRDHPRNLSPLLEALVLSGRAAL